MAPEDSVALQAAVCVQLRLAGAQGDAAGVDEACSIYRDARRVGNDEFGPLACDFYIAFQVAGVAAVDFVQDDARFAPRQPRVALNPAAQLALDIAAAVVQDGALPVYIKAAVDVAAHPRCTGGLDVDDRHAVGSRQYRGPVLPGCCWVCHDLRMRQPCRGKALDEQEGRQDGGGDRAQLVHPVRCQT